MGPVKLRRHSNCCPVGTSAKRQTFKTPSWPALANICTSPPVLPCRHWTSATALLCACRTCTSESQDPCTKPSACKAFRAAELGGHSRRTITKLPLLVPHASLLTCLAAPADRGNGQRDVTATPPSRPSAGSTAPHSSSPRTPELKIWMLFISRLSSLALCLAATTSRSPASPKDHEQAAHGSGTAPDMGRSRRVVVAVLLDLPDVIST
mmetsp:Transcript_70676/g.124690  ORF Transcript_70676/g.124690 Transcript_70676/m.124690 type:complete len:209 (+) Transcript_70676:177-803(+)